ncbi:cutinase family protein [Gordonia sp. 852002-10350_SCH5691597]|uniref:cutinase family protein n=1 Tax=Gordonia sp. 852002-10350_SCH5691597 TaxID=1834085 RepID=UPI0007E9FFC3|nr:cutinase family protein [Gordonia sp. 852002-10350_SCH5691597]OBA69018.1 cutinase [Gordonia sp. 852002-10350_SCH5691597]
MAAKRGATGRRKGRRLGRIALFLALLVIIAIVLIVILVITLLKPGPPSIPGGQGPSTSAPSPGRPEAQSADCPDVLTLVIPGTWESSADDDPMNPTANKASLMRRVSTALQNEYPTSRTEVYTVPYIAQFRNPTNLNDRQADYNVSRQQGYNRAAAKLRDTNKKCPLTRYVIMGFSQGAVIGGDLASNIGNGSGPIDASDQDLVLGVGLIADGRREKGQQNDIGPDPDGVGAEVALSGMGKLVPGITMTGPRSGGFGDLRDRVQSICAPGDLICDSPTVANPVGAVGQLAGAINNPVHAMYATKRYWQLDGISATQWMYGWSNKVIADAPHPAHN